MHRPLLIPLIICSLMAAGCGSKPAVDAPAPSPKAVEEEQSAAVSEPSVPAATPKERSTTVHAPPPVEPASKPVSDDGLRSIVAKLSRKEGNAWKIDETAAEKLAELGSDARDKLLPLFHDESSDVRRGAAYYLLGKFDRAQEDLVTAYVRLLSDEDRTVRGIALSAVTRLKPTQVAAAAPDLARLLANSDEDPQQRASAARLIGNAGSEAASLLPQLSEAAANDASPQVRIACLLAISRVAEPSYSVDVCRKSLKDSDAAVRKAALVRIKALGRDAAPAMEDLARLLEEPDEKTRTSAVEALVRIGAKSVPVLQAKLSSESVETRRTVVLALGTMGPLASPALPDLKKRLSDSDPKVKELAKAAITAIEPQ